MRIYFKNILAKFHPDPISNDGALAFYRAMLRRARLCHSMSSVRLSVCLWRSGMFFTQVEIIRKQFHSWLA